MEIQLNNGDFLTIKRYINKKTSNYIRISSNFSDDLYEKDEDFNFKGSEKDIKDILNEKLSISLDGVEILNFRQYIGYFFRDQDNQSDMFRLNKFVRSKDKDWKPAVANLLGIKYSLIADQYRLDDEISTLKNKVKELERNISEDTAEQIRNKITLLEDKKNKQELKFKQFDFFLKENNIDRELVEDIETKISEYNKKRNYIRQELEYIEKFKENEISLELDELESFFNEINIAFSKDLKVQYNDIINFNKIVSADRKEIFEKNRLSFLAEIKNINLELEKLNNDRKNALSILQTTDTMEKFKLLEKEVIEISNQIYYNQQILQEFEELEKRKREIAEKEKELQILIETIKSKLQNETLISIKEIFSKYSKIILKEDIRLSVGLNTNNKIQFNPVFVDDHDKDKGNTIQKLLCFIFAISLADFYREVSFFRVVGFDCPFDGDIEEYQNGLFEAIKELDTLGIQAIITTIDDEVKDSQNKDFVNQHAILHLSEENPLLIKF